MSDQKYYSISVLRFFVCSVITLGLYDIYWLFKNWECVRDNEKIDINPLIRAFLGFTFSYFLFQRINKALKQIGHMSSIPPLVIFILYTIGWAGMLGSPETLPLLLCLPCLPLLYVQKQINILHEKNGNEVQINPFTWPQIILIILGLLEWVGIALS